VGIKRAGRNEREKEKKKKECCKLRNKERKKEGWIETRKEEI
jgi:hypothetical protein